MVVDLLTEILEGIKEGKSKKKIAKEQYCSVKTIDRKIKSSFGVGFNELRYIIFNQIVVHTIRSTPNRTAAAVSLNSSSQNLWNYSTRHIGSNPTKIMEEQHYATPPKISQLQRPANI